MASRLPGRDPFSFGFLPHVFREKGRSHRGEVAVTTMPPGQNEPKPYEYSPTMIRYMFTTTSSDENYNDVFFSFPTRFNSPSAKHKFTNRVNGTRIESRKNTVFDRSPILIVSVFFLRLTTADFIPISFHTD